MSYGKRWGNLNTHILFWLSTQHFSTINPFPFPLSVSSPIKLPQAFVVVVWGSLSKKMTYIFVLMYLTFNHGESSVRTYSGLASCLYDSRNEWKLDWYFHFMLFFFFGCNSGPSAFSEAHLGLWYLCVPTLLWVFPNVITMLVLWSIREKKGETVFKRMNPGETWLSSFPESTMGC